jgi:hypothetical protein
MLVLGKTETIHEFLPISCDFSVRLQGAVNVDLEGAQRAFNHIVHASLRVGYRGGLIKAQRFLEQINCLLVRAVKCLDKLLDTLLKELANANSSPCYPPPATLVLAVG